MRNFSEKLILSVLQLLFLIFTQFAASAQSPEEMKKIFAQAESYFLYEEYDLANQLYILIETPENQNIKYKIGTCYLNIPGEKEKSIPYLEEAVRTASYDSKPGSYKENRAPLDAYFSLAKAYMINNDLDKGLLTLEAFKRISADTKGGMKNVGFIDQQIQACRNAIEFRSAPVRYSRKTLGSDFSEGAIIENPAVSFDGNSMAYTEKRGSVNAIFYSRKERGKWQTPVEITAELNAGDDCSTCSLNSDGTELYLYKTDNYDGAIYTSKYSDEKWSPVRKLNKNINTKFYESHAAVSSDGKKLYFTSNREGGQGNLDIYVSEKDATGDWGAAINLGPAVNTAYNEDTPFITENDTILYFSSEGHNSMGGYDNFCSRRNGKEWVTPVNLGYSINSSDDDKFFQPVNNGMNAYYSMTTDYKKKEIFYLGMGEVDVNEQYEISGKIMPADTLIAYSKDYPVHILNRETGDTIAETWPNVHTGRYSVSLIPGKYTLAFSGEGHLTQRIDTAISLSNPMPLSINVELQRDTSLVFDKINLTDIPVVSGIDSSILMTNMNVNDVGDINVNDADVLYYTVQVIALHNPVDVSYFKFINDMVVIYNDNDKFYRYTTGKFSTREEAYALRTQLINKGYPNDIFIKKVSK